MHLTVTCRSLICCVWGGGEEGGDVSGSLPPCFRVIIHGPWISQASVT
jgi:hypothetical protein